MKLFTLFLLLFSAIQAFAQTKPVGYWEKARQAAAADLKLVMAKMEAEGKKETTFNVCLADLLAFQKNYDQWFLDHYPEFLKLNSELDEAVALANQKLAKVQADQIEVNPIKGQGSAITMSLKEVVAYYQNFNARVRSCESSEVNRLKELQEIPEFNPIHVANSQVEAAVKRLVININADLKDQGVDYSLKFRAGGCGAGLELIIKAKLGATSTQLAFPLTENSASQIVIDDSSRFEALVNGRAQIASMPIDGLERAWRMGLSRRSASCKKKIGLASVVGISGTPMLSFNQVSGAENVAVYRSSHPESTIFAGTSSMAYTDGSKFHFFGDSDRGQREFKTRMDDVTTVGMGFYTNCVASAGGVECNGYANEITNQVPASLNNVVQLSLGAYYACAVTTQGGLKCWGNNDYNRVSGSVNLTHVKAVATGASGACALLDSGTVKCWGAFANADSIDPSRLTDIESVVAGESFFCALKSNGTVACWGNVGRIKVESWQQITQITAYDRHICGLMENGEVVCTVDSRDYGAARVPDDLPPAVEVATSEKATCAKLQSGKLRCWGDTEIIATDFPEELK